MTNPKTSAKKPARSTRDPVALGPGIHAATIELQEGASFRVKLLDGQRACAATSPE